MEEGKKEEEEVDTSTLKGKIISRYRTFRSKLRRDHQVVFLLAIFGIMGTIISTIITAKYSWLTRQKFAIKMYVGFMVLFMGLFITIFSFVHLLLSYGWYKVAALGIVTGFNKGISGGGYGPIAVSGQVICGRPERNAIATTSSSESIISASGVICFIASAYITDKYSSQQIRQFYFLTPYLVGGALASVPFSCYLTRLIRAKYLKICVGFSTTALGLYSVCSTYLSYYEVWTGAE
eukprot:TRINITY_DN4917_c0_g1_i3.p1 TRINITY_DN4917_c0_g1~~TRINITY_DN4917_c0_g1_i3.p1  ORF type:complete len:236 (+),score=66.53 TRINITY_DN4917_c0_g1_i3:820-1527(+)